MLAVLHYQKISNHSERTSNLQPFANQYAWHKINFPAEWKDCQKSEKNNFDVALNVLFFDDNDIEYVENRNVFLNIS